MPKLAWSAITDVPAETQVTIMGSQLPLRRYRHIPRFLQATVRIRKQLAQADGLVGYALDAQLMRKTFWTVSAWVGQTQLDGFQRADPHHHEIEVIRRMMLPTTFVFWAGTSGDLPVDWSEVRARLEARRASSDEDE